MISNYKLEIGEIVECQSKAFENCNKIKEQLKNPVKTTGHIIKNVEKELNEQLKHQQEELTPIHLDKVKIPNKVTIVRLVTDSYIFSSQLEKNKAYILMGEISQDKEHVVLQDPDTGKMFVGVETSSLEIIPPNEIKY
jgi:hypothetical protein